MKLMRNAKNLFASSFVASLLMNVDRSYLVKSVFYYYMKRDGITNLAMLIFLEHFLENNNPMGDRYSDNVRIEYAGT